jgi:hypothetical protein
LEEEVAVIIGQSTIVRLSIADAGIVSIDWSTNAGVERLYTLGAGAGTCGPPEYATVRDSQVTVNFSIYGGESSEISTCAADAQGACADSPATVIVNVAPGVCGNAAVEGLVDQKVFINSYSYSKDRVGHGTEQWAGNAYKRPAGTLPQGQYIKPLPNFVILGVAEGSIETEEATVSSDIQTLVGAKFSDDAIITTTYKANVAAAQISVGEHVFTHNGTFKRIGGSQFWDPTGSSGVKASANVTLNLQPVYTGQVPS